MRIENMARFLLRPFGAEISPSGLVGLFLPLPDGDVAIVRLGLSREDRPFDLGCRCLKLLDSCNGLLLFQYRYNHSEINSLIVCNPIAKASIDMDCSASRGMRLIFDPRASPHFKMVMVRQAASPAAGDATFELLTFSSATSDYKVSGTNLSVWLKTLTASSAYFYDAVRGMVGKTVEIEGKDGPQEGQFMALQGWDAQKVEARNSWRSPEGAHVMPCAAGLICSCGC